MRTLILTTAMCASLAACGGNGVNTPLERGAVGAGIGLGAGAVGAEVFGVDPVTGAILGGAAGAAIGAATSDRYN